MATRDEPNNYFVFVDMEKREMIIDKDGSYCFWLTKESAIDVVQKIHKDKPDFDMTKYGIALVTKTYTEYEEGRELEFTNIDVMYTFTQVL